jgi:hypothetical protein
VAFIWKNLYERAKHGYRIQTRFNIGLVFRCLCTCRPLSMHRHRAIPIGFSCQIRLRLRIMDTPAAHTTTVNSLACTVCIQLLWFSVREYCYITLQGGCREVLRESACGVSSITLLHSRLNVPCYGRCDARWWSWRCVRRRVLVHCWTLALSVTLRLVGSSTEQKQYQVKCRLAGRNLYFHNGFITYRDLWLSTCGNTAVASMEFLFRVV